MATQTQKTETNVPSVAPARAQIPQIIAETGFTKNHTLPVTIKLLKSLDTKIDSTVARIALIAYHVRVNWDAMKPGSEWADSTYQNWLDTAIPEYSTSYSYDLLKCTRYFAAAGDAKEWIPLTNQTCEALTHAFETYGSTRLRETIRRLADFTAEERHAFFTGSMPLDQLTECLKRSQAKSAMEGTTSSTHDYVNIVRSDAGTLTVRLQNEAQNIVQEADIAHLRNQLNTEVAKLVQAFQKKQSKAKVEKDKREKLAELKKKMVDKVAKGKAKNERDEQALAKLDAKQRALDATKVTPNSANELEGKIAS